MTRPKNSRMASWFSGSALNIRVKRTLAVSVFLIVASVAVFASISFVTKWGTEGLGDGQFEVPTGVAVDASGNVYVCEGGQRVQIFDNSGTFQSKFGSGGSVELNGYQAANYNSLDQLDAAITITYQP